MHHHYQFFSRNQVHIHEGRITTTKQLYNRGITHVPHQQKAAWPN
jgi:hypothetical protein